MATNEASYIQQVYLGWTNQEVRLYQGRMYKLFTVYTVCGIVSFSQEGSQLAPQAGLPLWDWWLQSLEEWKV